MTSGQWRDDVRAVAGRQGSGGIQREGGRVAMSPLWSRRINKNIAPHDRHTPIATHFFSKPHVSFFNKVDIAGHVDGTSTLLKNEMWGLEKKKMRRYDSEYNRVSKLSKGENQLNEHTLIMPEEWKTLLK